MAGRPIVLVTGGAGYIGSHATWALLDAGRRVVVVDDLSTGFRAAVRDAAVFIEADAGDLAAVGAILASYDVAAVMHFAALTIVPQSILDPLACYAANTVTSHALIAAAAAHGVRHFIFSSSAAVYGATTAAPVGEDTPPVPINPYGRSKLMTEMMLADAAAAHGMATARCAISLSRELTPPNAPDSQAPVPLISSRQHLRPRPGADLMSTSTERTSTRPTGPASGTTSTSRTLLPRTSRRSISFGSGPRGT